MPACALSVKEVELLKKIEDAKKKFLPYSHQGLSRNAFICQLILLGLEKLEEIEKRK